MSGLRIHLLGPVTVSRNGDAVPLPRSRKVRGLFAYLVVTGAPQSRSRLCDLLWNVPNDPRGELRWSLSKLRGVLDDGDRKRVVTGEDLIGLDLTDCHVDVVEIERVVKAGIHQATTETLEQTCDLFGGDLLDGMQVDDNPEFTGWLAAQRQRFRTHHLAILRELAERAPQGSEDIVRRLDAWLQLAPFDPRAHEVMLSMLVANGRIRDAEEHVAAAIRSFEEEGLDWSHLRAAWTAVRSAPAAPVRAVSPTPAAATDPSIVSPRRRASVAVMRFTDTAPGPGEQRTVADGLTEDIITRLAKLRVLFVIARGTVYALTDGGISPQEAGRILKVEYVVSGTVRRDGARLSVVVELAETEHGRIVWTDELTGVADDTFGMLDTIIDRIVAAIAEEIEASECQRAILKPPSSLDAWEAYHRGLWHMYRFTGPDNRQAEQFFRASLGLDPTFARAYAGLSFTHFQNAFLDLTPDHQQQIDLAFETATQSLGADERDPAAHWAMGRALWLRREQQESLIELERTIELSPNFALGHYTLGFVQAQSGDPRAAIEATNYSRQLSPFDPLQFGMLGSRALAHIRLGELDEASEWAIKAAARPNAHVHILAIAAVCLGLAHRSEDARAYVARIRARVPSYSVEDFLRSFHFARDTDELLRGAARNVGFG